MNEYPINLMNCFVVIWKRKLLIMLGTLVCLVAGGVVSLRLTETYRAESLIKIGKIVNPNSISSSPFVLLDTIDNLVETIPIEYALGETLRYDLNVEAVKRTSLIKIILGGPGEIKTKEFLNGVIEKLTDDHLRKTESKIQFYKVLIEGLEIDIKEIQNDLAQEALELEEMNILMDKEMNVEVDKEMNVEVDIKEADPFTLLMIQNKKIEIQNINLRMKQIAQNNLKQSRINIRSIRDDIFLHQLTINTLKENKTKQIGGVKESIIKPKKKRNVMLAGVVGLIMSLFLAASLEYLGKVREVERKKKKSNSVLG